MLEVHPPEHDISPHEESARRFSKSAVSALWEDLQKPDQLQRPSEEGP